MSGGWTRTYTICLLGLVAALALLILLTPYKPKPDEYDVANPQPYLYFDLAEMQDGRTDPGFRDSLLAIQRDNRIAHFDFGGVWVEGRIAYLSGDTLLLSEYRGGIDSL